MADSILPAVLPGAAPTLVGRAGERARLREHLAAAFAGRGSLVLIGGEAGIGKTALAEALLREATERGALTLVGRCYDRTATPPYGPWRELMRTASGDADLPPWPAALAPDGAGAHPAGPDALFGQVRDGLAARAARRPLVVLLDDLHWADPASLDLLRAVARQLGELPVLLLATHRTDEVTRHHALYQLIPLLLREAPAAPLDLAPLTEADTRALVASRYWLAAAEAARLVDYLHARACGNPFYVRELLRHLEERGLLRPGATGWQLADLAEVRLPTLLRQVLDGRAARLGEDARRLLAVAAVIGHEVPLALWATVAATDEDTVLDTVERAAEAHLLVADGAGTGVAFAHALVRAALYEGVLPPRRRMWHRRIAEGLLALPDPDPDALAHHLRQAGDPRAAAWLVAAGERAERAYAWLGAAERFEAALRLRAEGGAAARERGWLAYRLAGLRYFADERQALGAGTEAARLAGEAGDPLLAAAAAFLTGSARCVAGDLRGGIAEMASAVAALEALPPAARVPPGAAAPLDPAPWRAALVGSLATAGRFTEALALGAGAAGADAALAAAHTALGRPERALPLFAHARQRQRAAGHHMQGGAVAQAELWTLLVPYRADRPAELRPRLAEAERAFARAGGVVALPPRFARLPLLVLGGEWGAARRVAAALRVRSAPAVPRRLAASVIGPLVRAQGQAALAWRLVWEALPAGPATAPGDAAFLEAQGFQRLAAALALDAGDLPLAQAWLDAHDRWLAWSGAVLGQAEGQLGWAACHRAAGHLALAQRHAERARAHAAAPRQPLALLAARRVLGELGTVTGRHTEAAAHLAAALALADACAAPYERALTLLALAELRGAAGPRAGVAPLLAEVRALCRPLGAAPALARADALAAALVAPGYPDGLTAREVEVLRLYAADLSYRAVGERLSIAPRTVGAHVRNIYGKTGVTSRLAAARYAAAHGLA